MAEKQNGEKPFWKSVKFYYALIAVGAFLALVLTGTLTVTTEQAINFILTVFGFNVGAHALTNISAIIGQFFGRRDGTSIEPMIEATLSQPSEDEDEGK